jgi:hypothetical protein
VEQWILSHTYDEYIKTGYESHIIIDRRPTGGECASTAPKRRTVRYRVSCYCFLAGMRPLAFTLFEETSRPGKEALVPCDPIACHLSLGQVSLAGAVRGDGAAGRARSDASDAVTFLARVARPFPCAYTAV